LRNLKYTDGERQQIVEVSNACHDAYATYKQLVPVSSAFLPVQLYLIATAMIKRLLRGGNQYTRRSIG